MVFFFLVFFSQVFFLYIQLGPIIRGRVRAKARRTNRPGTWVTRRLRNDCIKYNDNSRYYMFQHWVIPSSSLLHCYSLALFQIIYIPSLINKFLTLGISCLSTYTRKVRTPLFSNLPNRYGTYVCSVFVALSLPQCPRTFQTITQP
ncbi:hypothetical protein F4820DRAFT_230336 [Hypoxylon rubiginosum]|uniref:Uncharacterized protein n=1 Tax=Hypoxylon rubiginosum TaxID=110542 RepID=A0ACB9Z800_9PEZI|nr:hypothetical protein F4820DRAFT_230336 [Hypoxylon rubiginosum]